MQCSRLIFTTVHLLSDKLFTDIAQCGVPLQSFHEHLVQTYTKKVLWHYFRLTVATDYKFCRTNLYTNKEINLVMERCRWRKL